MISTLPAPFSLFKTIKNTISPYKKFYFFFFFITSIFQIHNRWSIAKSGGSRAKSSVSSSILLSHPSVLIVSIPLQYLSFILQDAAKMSITEKFPVVTFKYFPVTVFVRHDKTDHYVPVPEPIIHPSIHSFLCLHFMCYVFVLFSPCSAPLSDVSLPYVTVVEFCPRMAHQAMNTSLWRRKDGRKRSF